MARNLIINEKRAVVGGKKKGTVTIDGVAYPFDNRNLMGLPNIPEVTYSGITYSIDKGIFKISGRPDATKWLSFGITLHLNGRYVLSCFNPEAYSTSFDLRLYAIGAVNTYSVNTYRANAYSGFNLPEDNYLVQIRIGSDVLADNWILKPMIIEGSTPPEEWSR